MRTHTAARVGWWAAFLGCAVVAVTVKGLEPVATRTQPTPETVVFKSGDLTLEGLLWKPTGSGPFPAVLYNHGSGRSYEKEFAALGPLFVGRGVRLVWPVPARPRSVE